VIQRGLVFPAIRDPAGRLHGSQNGVGSRAGRHSATRTLGPRGLARDADASQAHCKDRYICIVRNYYSDMAESRIYRRDNTLVFEGRFRLQELHTPLAALHHAVQQAGYSDITLDFSQCQTAYPAPMLGLCAQVAKWRRAQINVSLVLPSDEKLRRLFMNANWAHFISPRDHDPSRFRGHRQVPAICYSSPTEQASAVNRIINAILGAIPDVERKDFAALEWSVNELTDNVLVHSQSHVGGFVQVSTFVREKKRISFIVADAGIGIPTSLRSGHPEITSDVDALDKAIREGVTRDKSVGQGNGLFGSYRICSESKGFFQVDSGHAKLSYTEQNGLRVREERVPYDGTLVVAEIDFSVPHLLEEALKFDGKIHRPVDYLELHYEDDAAERVMFKVAEESDAFGTRIAGTPLRYRLLNLLRMCPAQPIIVNFSGVALVSSSFADEFIGKLFAELGPMTFMGRVRIVGASQTVQHLLDRAIAQRMSSGSTPGRIGG
jgi:hypothetical protein